MLNQTLVRREDRNTFLWKIGLCLLLCIAGSWGLVLIIDFGTEKGTDGSELFNGFFIAYLMIGINLVDERESKWWSCFLFVVFLILMVIGRLLSDRFQLKLPLFALWPFIIGAYVLILRQRYAAKYCEQDVDAIAASLGLRWEDQSLWQMNEKIKSGKRDEMIKQYRDEHHSTWDEAHQAIDEWSGTQLELKLHLLKEYVAKLKIEATS